MGIIFKSVIVAANAAIVQEKKLIGIHKIYFLENFRNIVYCRIPVRSPPIATLNNKEYVSLNAGIKFGMRSKNKKEKLIPIIDVQIHFLLNERDLCNIRHCIKPTPVPTAIPMKNWKLDSPICSKKRARRIVKIIPISQPKKLAFTQLIKKDFPLKPSLLMVDFIL